MGSNLEPHTCEAITLPPSYIPKPAISLVKVIFVRLRGSILKGTTEGQRESQTVYARTPFARVREGNLGLVLSMCLLSKEKELESVAIL